MQPTSYLGEPAPPSDAPLLTRRLRTRLACVAGVILALLLLALIPPLVNVNRFQRRIARSIGDSLGRPVHLDSVTLNLLPWPGFTLQNFVVNEDPAFGAEPIIRANEVKARLRVGSLWRGRVEFSRISLTDPSVNLVHLPDGRWNLQSILMQAARIQAAPTAQPYATPAPRFPYIEATGGRINLKLGQTKTPYSLTEADFALWLPEPERWHLRLAATPARTDTIAPEGQAATGSLRVEGTLGRAPALDLVPIDLHAELRDAQLGGLSRLLLGHDAGLRGDLTLTADLAGTAGRSALHATIDLSKGRRADFVPPRLLAVEATCDATAANLFHTFSGIECDWPRRDSSDPNILILAASVPDLRRMDTATARLTLPAVPMARVLDWIGLLTPRPPVGLLSVGTLAGDVTWQPVPTASPLSPASFQTELTLSGAKVQSPALGAEPLPLGLVLARADDTSAGSFVLQPLSLPLGGKEPAALEARADASGYSLHLTGSAIPSRLLALGDIFPQLGEGLRDLLIPPPALTTPDDTPIPLNLTATRSWGGPQTWARTIPIPPPNPKRHALGSHR